LSPVCGFVGDLPGPPALMFDADALFVDFDGTLAALQRRPQLVVIGVTMRRALIRIRDCLAGRLAVISGRDIDTLQRLLAVDGIGLAGVHGLERRGAGNKLRWHRPHPSAAMRLACDELHAVMALRPRILIEDKGVGVAVHFRDAPDLATVVREATQRVAARHGLTVQAGKMVYEVCEPGPDKGAALRAFMAEPPFAGARPIFVGDDETDESGFAAATALGGFGILVGNRLTAARYRLADISAVEAWLWAAGVRG
jgi:trehalose 6-phosphate phosphatase